MAAEHKAIGQGLQTEQESILSEWIAEVFTGSTAFKGSEAQLTVEGGALLKALAQGLAADESASRFDTPAWAPMREALSDLSTSRAAQGSSAGDTSLFVLALKKPFFSLAQKRLANDPGALTDTLWWASLLVDKLAQLTLNSYQLSREDVIRRQQQELLELSTPVVKLWDGVLAVPMIGTLDSARTQTVMETLLQRIVETGAEIAILDITGVPTVDTMVAQHLLKTVTAIRLMGSECLISGVRPQIAQTIVHLGIDLQGIVTKATLADALALAMKKTGHVVTRVAV